MMQEPNEPQAQETEPCTEQATPQTAPEATEPKAEPKAKEDKKDKKASLLAAKTKIETLEKQMAELKDQLLRTTAEYENFRRRSAKEKDGVFNNGVGYAADRLLPVLDTLMLAAGVETADENYKKGVLLTVDKCNEAFKQIGITEMPALGAMFDPELHSAVLQQPAPEGTESGTVLQVLQAGYLLGEKVLRHATVIVAE